ncbi:MAG: hypothetical protein H6517_06965 [Microthrixaceae bacterium]|nr:hypothetical protein [Microthrixaceae bacterium]
MRLTYAVAGLLVLLGVSCGVGSGGDESGGSDPGASGQSSSEGGCAFLSTEDVASIVGEDVVDASELPAGCQWNLADPGPTGSAAYDWQSIDAAVYDDNLESAEAAGFTVEPVDGLGDEAFLRLQVNTEGVAINGEVWVRSGDSALYVRSQGIEYDDDVAANQLELAERLESR